MIHKFKLGGFNALLDVNSGGVHIIDDLTYDLLDNVEPPFEEKCPEDVVRKLSKMYDSKDIEDCYEEIVSLYNDKILFSEDDYEKYALSAVASPIKAMCLHIAHDCNLRCKYCFASTGDFGQGRMLMDYETGKRAIDFLIERSGDRKFLEVDFFGGEPSLNFGTVEKLVEYARSQEEPHNKKFRFTVTTNGVHLTDEMIDFINKEMYNVVLSIDGRKEVNDRMRVRVDGTGSYDRIIPNFKKLVDKRPKNKDWYVRGTYTHNNTDFTNDIFHMADLGFTELSMEPVVCAPDDPYALTYDDLPILFEQYEILAKEMLKREKEGRPLTFYHYMIDLTGGPCIYKRISGCGSGTEYMAVTPWGDLYPCHQFVGDEKYKLGDIFNGVSNTKIQDEFKLCNAYARPDCKDCWARLYCSGGCAANAYHATGSITGIYEYGCELFRKRMECAIMMKVAEAEE